MERKMAAGTRSSRHRVSSLVSPANSPETGNRLGLKGRGKTKEGDREGERGGEVNGAGGEERGEVGDRGREEEERGGVREEEERGGVREEDELDVRRKEDEGSWRVWTARRSNGAEAVPIERAAYVGTPRERRRSAEDDHCGSGWDRSHRQVLSYSTVAQGEGGFHQRCGATEYEGQTWSPSW